MSSSLNIKRAINFYEHSLKKKKLSPHKNPSAGSILEKRLKRNSNIYSSKGPKTPTNFRRKSFSLISLSLPNFYLNLRPFQTCTFLLATEPRPKASHT